jgi:hypothetical protein
VLKVGRTIADLEGSERCWRTTSPRPSATARRDDARGTLARAQISLCRSVLRLCEARGLALTPAQSARVNSEHDVATLSAWVERAVSVDAPEAIFDRTG